MTKHVALFNATFEVVIRGAKSKEEALKRALKKINHMAPEASEIQFLTIEEDDPNVF